MEEDKRIVDAITPSSWVSSNAMITVLGVGGGGCNAVNYMFRKGIQGCNFVVCNTDSQALSSSPVPVQIQMGRGLGAGTNPINGRNAALESQDEIERTVLASGTQMLFITAGMGGGTGTGAAPVIAKMAKEKDILTVAVVTLPFRNEGNEALSRAIDGVHELEKNVDSMLIINNEKLHEHYGNLLIQDAFPKADEVLATAVQGIVDLIKKPGYINVDFKDVENLMKNSGMALMGSGTGTGENRLQDAVKATFESPLLNDFDLKSAKKVLTNISCTNTDQGLSMDEYQEINRMIDEYTGRANNFKRGLRWDDDLDPADTVRITSIVTGLRFSEAIGPTQDMGNYIIINKDYKYSKSEAAKEGIQLHEDSASNQIGFNSKNNQRYFSYDPDVPPVLVPKPGQSLADLENTPAIRRIQKPAQQ